MHLHGHILVRGLEFSPKPLLLWLPPAGLADNVFTQLNPTHNNNILVPCINPETWVSQGRQRHENYAIGLSHTITQSVEERLRRETAVSLNGLRLYVASTSEFNKIEPN